MVNRIIPDGEIVWQRVTFFLFFFNLVQFGSNRVLVFSFPIKPANLYKIFLCLFSLFFLLERR